MQLHRSIHLSPSLFFLKLFYLLLFFTFPHTLRKSRDSQMVAKVIQEKINPMRTSRLPMAMGYLLLYVD